MRYRIIFIALVILVSTGVFLFQNREIPVDKIIEAPVANNEPTTEDMPQAPADDDTSPDTEPTSAPATDEPATSVNIDMAYVHESPDGSWTGSWKNGCEEAAIVMIEYYYAGIKSPTIEQSMIFMQTLFDTQKELYGSDANSDAARNLHLIETHTNFNARIVENPNLQDIKQEVDAGRPVIALHHGFALQNKNIPFLATGSSYHATVVTGYDDVRQEFIVHDTGDAKAGDGYRYDYELFMGSLHDYNYVSQLADGPARVLFTAPK